MASMIRKQANALRKNVITSQLTRGEINDVLEELRIITRILERGRRALVIDWLIEEARKDDVDLEEIRALANLNL